MYQNYNMDQVVLPLDLEVKIPETDIVKAVNGLVESIPEDLFYLVEKKTEGLFTPTIIYLNKISN